MRKTRQHRHHKGATNKNDDCDVQKLIKMYPPPIKQNQNFVKAENEMMFSKKDTMNGLTKSTTVRE